MALEPQVKQFLQEYQQSNFPPYSSFSPSALRETFLQAFRKKSKPPEINMHRVETLEIPGKEHSIPLRVFYPTAESHLPALMYFHGGGFVIRDNMDIYDYTCRMIAKQVGCIVIAVDFRLAPEHPYPAAPADCYSATCWVANNYQTLNIDGNHFGVWGESCGGNLAAVVAQMARDRGGPHLRCQIIISPMLDLNFDRDSYREFAEGYFLTMDSMKWFWGHYLSKLADETEAYALPIKANNLSDLPSALVVTTEYDVLRDEGKEYSEQLTKAGTKTLYRCYAGLIHGFFDLYHRAPGAKAACDEIMQQAKQLLYGS